MNASVLSGFKDFSPEAWLSRAAPRLPAAMAWVLAIALGIQAAAIVRTVIAPPAAPMGSAVNGPSPSRRSASNQPLDVSGLLGAHLFGVAAANQGSAGNPADAPRTQLALVLTGTIAGASPQHGYGIIGENATSAKVYAVGEVISGGPKLNAVYPDRVIIDRGGTLEALLLPRNLPSSGGPPHGSAAALRPAGGAQFANDMRRLISQNPNSLSEIMRPQPVFANGQQRGYRVYPGRNRREFVRLGLMPGDLVTAVNGTPLDDPARGNEIFNTLGTSSEVHVTVERGGIARDLTLNMAQLASQAQQLNTAPPPPSTPGGPNTSTGSGENPMGQPPPADSNDSVPTNNTQ